MCFARLSCVYSLKQASTDSLLPDFLVELERDDHLALEVPAKHVCRYGPCHLSRAFTSEDVPSMLGPSSPQPLPQCGGFPSLE